MNSLLNMRMYGRWTKFGAAFVTHPYCRWSAHVPIQIHCVVVFLTHLRAQVVIPLRYVRRLLHVDVL